MTPKSVCAMNCSTTRILPTRECPLGWRRLGGSRPDSDRAPLLRQHRVDELTLPLTLHPFVLDQVRFATHTKLLENTRGADIARLRAAGNAVESNSVESERQQSTCCFRRISLALMSRVNDETQFALRVSFADTPQREISDDFAGLAKDRDRTNTVALAGDLDSGDLTCQ